MLLSATCSSRVHRRCTQQAPCAALVHNCCAALSGLFDCETECPQEDPCLTCHIALESLSQLQF